MKYIVFTGYPSELYYRGSGMWETIYGMSLAFPLVLYFFLPVYFNLGITSVYQVSFRNYIIMKSIMPKCNE